MPSLIAPATSEEAKTLKLTLPVLPDSMTQEEGEKIKKKKDGRSKRKGTSDSEEDGQDELKKKRKSWEEEKKEKKKRKTLAEEEVQEVIPMDDGFTVNEVELAPNAVSRFRVSDVLRERLKSKGIESLFPIQAMTFDLILDGSDLVGRARTGQGKTLAFVLPILESLTNGRYKDSRRTGHGRPPSVLVLLPTRELANQVHADFEFYGRALNLSACSVYGGAPMRSQEFALKKGVDIVVGTPGRVKDHLERGNLDLKSLKFRVLDEADEMLNMGFVEDVELILGKVADVTKVQTLLFSATLPDWVKKISMRFLKSDKKTADLVGSEKLKASASVKHLVLPCNKAARPQIIPDLIRCYSHGGRTIIFTETKESASELSGLLPGSRALHGDIQQAQREVVLAGFRSGRFLILVATNVAARGLDINDVQLIIQCEPPRDVEAYIHRSGRTGRAGNTGVAILLYEPRYKHSISRIERESGVKFEHIAAPQPSDVAGTAGSEAANAITNVSDSVVPIFQEQAEQLLSSSGLPPIVLLAKALAKAAGYTDIKKRSLLSSMENYVTLLLKSGQPIYTPGYAFSILKRFLPDEKISVVKGVTVTADGKGAVFDVPVEEADAFLEGGVNDSMVSMEVLKTLPPLHEEQTRGNSGKGRFGASGSVRRGSRGRSGFSSKGGGGRSIFARGGRGRGGRGSRFGK